MALLKVLSHSVEVIGGSQKLSGPIYFACRVFVPRDSLRLRSES